MMANYSLLPLLLASPYKNSCSYSIRAGAVWRIALPRGACAFGRVWMLEHCSGSSQVLRAHDTILGTLQHRHKTVQDLYILLVMVPKGTR